MNRLSEQLDTVQRQHTADTNQYQSTERELRTEVSKLTKEVLRLSKNLRQTEISTPVSPLPTPGQRRSSRTPPATVPWLTGSAGSGPYSDRNFLPINNF